MRASNCQEHAQTATPSHLAPCHVSQIVHRRKQLFPATGPPPRQTSDESPQWMGTAGPSLAKWDEVRTPTDVIQRTTGKCRHGPGCRLTWPSSSTGAAAGEPLIGRRNRDSQRPCNSPRAHLQFGLPQRTHGTLHGRFTGQVLPTNRLANRRDRSNASDLSHLHS